MKHHRSHTPEAIAMRADHVSDLGTVADIMGGEDHRNVCAYFINSEADFDCGLDGSERLPAGELIGIIIGGDDPSWPVEVLDRDQAFDMFGVEWVYGIEADRSNQLQSGEW